MTIDDHPYFDDDPQADLHPVVSHYITNELLAGLAVPGHPHHLAVLPIDLLIAQVHTIVPGVAADQAVPVPGHPHLLTPTPALFISLEPDLCIYLY